MYSHVYKSAAPLKSAVIAQRNALELQFMQSHTNVYLSKMAWGATLSSGFVVRKQLMSSNGYFNRVKSYKLEDFPLYLSHRLPY